MIGELGVANPKLSGVRFSVADRGEGTMSTVRGALMGDDARERTAGDLVTTGSAASPGRSDHRGDAGGFESLERGRASCSSPSSSSLK